MATCPCDRRLLGERQRIQFGPDGYRRQQLREDGVARLTARKAVRVLANEGPVEVVQGRGTYVAGRG